ncbi:MAG: hypothetical protein P4L71_01245 [Acetobacteraceae bacterium]|nr:hypothetical protein [Acetobacteraceae bacterium]
MTASVIADAHAAGAALPPPSPASSVQPPSPADFAKPLSSPPIEVQQPSHADAGGAAQEIYLHRSQIEEREQRLTEREAAAAAVEKRLTDRINELLAIQSHLEALVKDYKEQDDGKWVGLVKLYEGMRPRDAASIFDGLDKPVLLEIMARMKPAKASAVIALMLPDNARQVTADLAGRRSTPTASTN